MLRGDDHIVCMVRFQKVSDEEGAYDEGCDTQACFKKSANIVPRPLIIDSSRIQPRGQMVAYVSKAALGWFKKIPLRRFKTFAAWVRSPPPPPISPTSTSSR